MKRRLTNRKTLSKDNWSLVHASNGSRFLVFPSLLLSSYVHFFASSSFIFLFLILLFSCLLHFVLSLSPFLLFFFLHPSFPVSLFFFPFLPSSLFLYFSFLSIFHHSMSNFITPYFFSFSSFVPFLLPLSLFLSSSLPPVLLQE